MTIGSDINRRKIKRCRDEDYEYENGHGNEYCGQESSWHSRSMMTTATIMTPNCLIVPWLALPWLDLTCFFWLVWLFVWLEPLHDCFCLFWFQILFSSSLLLLLFPSHSVVCLRVTCLALPCPSCPALLCPALPFLAKYWNSALLAFPTVCSS